MNIQIQRQARVAREPDRVGKAPLRQGVAPEGGACVSEILRAAGAPDVAEHATHERARRRHGGGGAADLGHGGCDQVGLDELDGDAVGLQLGA